MSEQDQNPTGTANGQNPEGTAGDGGTEKKAPEGFVSKEQFAASQQEAIRLSKELETFKKGSNLASDKNLPDDESKLFPLIEKYEQKKAADAKKAEEELKSSLDKLHTIHGDFDDKKLVSIVDEYGVFTDAGAVKWEKAIELYKKLGNPVVKKAEVGGRTQDKSLEVEKVDVKGKNMFDLVNEGLSRFGMKRE